MPVFVRIYRKPFRADEPGGKWYARRVKVGETTLDTLAERIQRNTTFTRGEVHGLLIELVEVMRDALQAGETVNLQGLGRFHLSVKSRLMEQSDDFRADRDIAAVTCRFVPTGRRCHDGTLITRLTDGVDVRRVDEVC